ncbi:uncharacterized protein N7503_002912 [Penicillium pulvis]|uniref:uncharacterized protein n=1 Tax=Penicillium pulvis TaxID=1562058 RepID=UPI0025484F58|nr:uncharacterized protein N7503_002912 [Penicillium pulvis]KAJ5810694.1 hypothetical protein N7503_002912 [Penicillium pulvis]
MSLNNPIHPPFQSSSPTDIPRTISSSQRDGPHIHGEATELVPSPHGDPPAAEAQDGTSQQPAFQPFFTLIEDIPAGEYHHPTVHYIFSDDDTDIITEAALRSLEAQQDALPANKKHVYIGQHDETEGREPSTLLPPPIPGVQEKYVVLDVEPVPASEHITPAAVPATINFGAGITNTMSTSPATQPSPTGSSSHPHFRVASAKSFSPDWQVMRSEMVPAPTFENNDGDGTGHGLMLKIHGTAGLPFAAESGKERGTPRLEDMMNQFAKRMAELQTVIDSADVEEDVETEEPHSGDGEPRAGADQEQEQAQELPREQKMSADEQAQDGKVSEQEPALDEVEG